MSGFAYVVLKAFSLFAFLSMGLPVMLYGDAAAFGEIRARRLAVYALYLLGTFLAGYYVKCRINSSKNTDAGESLPWLKHLLLKFITLMAGMILMALPLLCLHAGKHFLPVCGTLGACAIFFYYIGVWSCRKDYISLTKPFTAGLQLAVSFFCYVGVSADRENPEAAQELIVLNLLLSALSAAVVANQMNITRLAERRPDTQTLIPRNLRQRNAAIITVFSLAFFICYLFRGYIAKLLVLIVSAVLWVIGVIAGFMNIPDSGKHDFPADLQNSGGIAQNYVLEILLGFLMAGLTIYLLWRLRFTIIGRVKDLISFILDKLRYKKETMISFSEFAFTDYFEETVAEKTEKKDSLSREIRRYKKIKNPEQKLRFSYKIFMRWLKEKNVNIKPSDTAAESIEKGKHFYSEDYSRVAEYICCYEEVRYGDRNTGSNGLVLADEIIGSVQKNI